MVKILKKINVLMNKKQKRAMCGLIAMMIIGAFLETLGVAMVVPVVTLVITPDKMEQNEIVQKIYNMLHLGSLTQFTVLVMLALILIFVIKNLFLFLQQKCLFRFVFSNQFDTAEKMIRSYVRKDYEFYLDAETSVIQRSITADVSNMYALILAVLQIASEMIVFIFLAAVLLTMDARMTIVIAALLIATMVVIMRIIKPIMNRTGKENQDYGASMYQWIAQTIGGIKEIKVAGKEHYFVDEYGKQGKGYVKAMERYNLFSNSPKLLIETVCIAGMLAYILVLILTGGDVTDMVPVLTAFAMAAIRLMPSASRINNQMTSMAFNEPFFFNVSDNLVEETSGTNIDLSYAVDAEDKLPVTNSLELKEITYHYPNSERLIFDKASMTIPVGNSIGIVGPSGAGKTTIIDILLGLLQVQEGSILADGVNVMEHYREWLKNIGYIPQMIFLLDADIRTNVAFGVPEEEIDEDRLWYALKEAQLDEFVKSLPEGVYTGIGERGIRLSGGQRQRIGIARALYNDPEVLILDEATSALDNDTEAAIMDSINRLHGRKTLIIIAHRLQTIEKCDMVFRVENGKITKER